MLRPLNNRVLLEVVEKKREVAGLIIATEEATPVKEATVRALPPKEAELIVGDRVLAVVSRGLPAAGLLSVPREDILGVFDAE